MEPPHDPRHQLGQEGERRAEAFLRRRRYKTVARRYTTPVGELDLVLRDGDTLVFVEVKTRRDRNLADPEDAVTSRKRQRLLRAARWFIIQKHWEDRPCRFDVVAVTLPESGEAEIRHHVDAFAPRG